MSVKAKQRVWEHDKGRLALLVVAGAALGMAMPVGVVWAALMIWHRDFKRKFDSWYTRWVLAGLAADVLLGAPIATALNVPPSWLALLLVGAGAYMGLRGRL